MIRHIVTFFTTLFLSLVSYAQVNVCTCWIEPDETYSLVEFSDPNNGSTNELIFPFDFNLYGTAYNGFWINTNGNITFDGPLSEPTSEDFPDDRDILAPFWADVNLACEDCGQVYYKITPEAVFLNWKRVKSSSTSIKENSFQLIFTPNNGSVLEDQHSVQFCYGNMEWANENEASEVPAFIKVNSNQASDSFQLGRFSNDTEDYLGFSDENSGVNWLDNMFLSFDASRTDEENLPVTIVQQSLIDIVYLCNNTDAMIDLTFFTPETDQIIEIDIDISGFPSAQVNISDENYYRNVLLNLSSEGIEEGEYLISMSISDSGDPSEVTILEFPIVVQNITVPAVNIYSEGDLVQHGFVRYCKSQKQAQLETPDGFDCFWWSNGSTFESDSFEEGFYSLKASYSGCVAESDTISVYEEPPFELQTGLQDETICLGDSARIGISISDISNPYPLDSIYWEVVGDVGSIVETNPASNTIGPYIKALIGSYKVTALAENGCVGTDYFTVFPTDYIPELDSIVPCNNHQMIFRDAFTSSRNCYNHIYLYDSDGDGWEGANLEIYIDGVGPHNFNISSAFPFIATSVLAYHGQLIEYYFVSGIDDDDIRIRIYNSHNDSVFDSDNENDQLASGNTPFFSQVTDCNNVNNNILAQVQETTGVWTVDAPSGGENYSFIMNNLFSPLNSFNLFTAPENFSGEYLLSFESDVCGTSIDIPLIFSHTDAGEVTSSNGNVTETIYLENGPTSEVSFNSLSSSTLNYDYIITTQDSMIFNVTSGSFDFENLGVGEYLVFGVSYSGELIYNLGESVLSVFSSECFELSDDGMEVIVELIDGVGEFNKTQPSIWYSQEEDLLHIDHTSSIGKLYVFEASGRIVKEITIPAGSYLLDTSDLISGFYATQLVVGDRVTNFKWVQ